jgi:hypothetical protein
MFQIAIRKDGIDVLACLSEGWDLIKDQYGLFVLINFLISILTLVPYINWIYQGPLACGFYYCALAKMRGERVRFGMMFKGFNLFIPAFIIGIVTIIPTVILQYTPLLEAITEIMPAGSSAIIILLYLSSIVWLISISFAYPLVMDYKLTALEAIKVSIMGAASNVIGIIMLIFGVSILFFLLVVIPYAILAMFLGWMGFIVALVGFFLVMPFMWAAFVVMYKQIFPDDPNLRQTYSILLP